MQRLANDRVQAIARDERIGTRAGVPLARARVAKMGDDTGGILLEANAGTPGKHAVGAQPLDDGIVQHSMQRAAMDRALRIGVARIASERLAMDQLPEPDRKSVVAGKSVRW